MMALFRYLLVAVFTCCLSLSYAIDATKQFDSPEQEQRYLRITEDLRCLVCQNQSVSDSNAPLAKDLRDQVEKMLKEGKSDEEIVAYMTERYGDFVLFTPPFQFSTLLLFLAPFLLTFFGMMAIWRVSSRNQTQATSAERFAAMSSELKGKVAEVRRELDDFEK